MRNGMRDTEGVKRPGEKLGLSSGKPPCKGWPDGAGEEKERSAAADFDEFPDSWALRPREKG